MVLVVAGCVVAPAQEPGSESVIAAQSATVAAGLAIATENCAACHAIGKTGASPNPASPPLRTLSARYPIESLAESFAEGVFVGHPVMPEFRLEPDEIDALLAWIESIQE